MNKLRFVADNGDALTRTMDYLVSRKLRGHGNWMIGNILEGSDGKSHFDVVSFSEDPDLSIERIKMYTADGTTVTNVPLDVKPSEPITTAREVRPSFAHEMTNKVLSGEDASAVVEEFTKNILSSIKLKPSFPAEAI